MKSQLSVDELKSLMDYAKTDVQRNVLNAVIDADGDKKQAAEKLGRHVRKLEEAISRVKGYATNKHDNPDLGMDIPLPEGWTQPHGTLHIKDGKIVQSWPRIKQDAVMQEQIMRETIEAMKEELPRERPIKKLKAIQSDKKLLNKFVITDYHLGMLAWHEETGADWNMNIAEELLIDWFRQAIKQAPKAHTALFVQLGDFQHFDGLETVTPTSHHVLDADTRLQKMIRVSIRVTRRVIRMLAETHDHVHFICAEGNHDIKASNWGRESYHAIYEDNPRITVDTNPDPYYCYEFGANAFFAHHGHKRKMNQIDTVFVAKFREVYGRTKHHFADMGHLHHERVLETNLMLIQQHRTLAAPDAHASRGGWMSGRDACVTTYHIEHGRIGMHYISAKMLEAG